MGHLCSFCGNRADSREHVWPRWLARIIEQLPGEKKLLFNIRTDKHGHRKKWQSPKPEIVTKKICKTCNEGWMSDLEKDASSILRPMIYRDGQTLTGKQQETIALWIVKTAMVLDSISAEVSFYEMSERTHFYKSFFPPGTVNFYLGFCSGTYWSGFTEFRILLDPQRPPRSRSYILTMSFGGLVLQFCNTKAMAEVVEYRNVKGEWSTVELVPPFPDPIRWPPADPAFDDSEKTILAFAERFGGIQGLAGFRSTT